MSYAERRGPHADPAPLPVASPDQDTRKRWSHQPRRIEVSADGILLECYGCRRMRAFTLFDRNVASADGLSRRCRLCRGQEPHRSAERRRAYSHDERRAAAARVSQLRRRFGLEPGEYEALLRAQEGRCPLCGRTPEEIGSLHPKTGKTMPLHVDHDHRSGEVRGLLCQPCNMLLGRVEELKPEWVEAARKYLDRPPASRAIK